MNAADRRRQTFLGHLLATTLIVASSFVAVTATSLFVPVIAHINDRTLSEGSKLGVAEHLLRLHESFWPMVVFVLISCVVASLVLYIRMTGPLVRFVQIFQSIARGGTPNPIVIRRADYLHEEKHALNAMLDALRTRNEAIREASEALENALAEGESVAIEGRAKALVEALEPQRNAQP